MLHRLLSHAESLPVYGDVRTQAQAITEQCSLLADPDPVPGLCAQLTHGLRETLVAAHKDSSTLYTAEMEKLEGASEWSKLTPGQRNEILSRHGLGSVTQIKTGTEAELLQSLDGISLENWVTLRDALPQRFARALYEAAKLLEPKTRHITLPKATLKNEEDLNAWLQDLREKIREYLKQGPVIV